ncbi:phosphomethylpyrimidine kinase [gut metagenome]|uniref:Phosphomethylpyrimidine kinase n=1 Tax=gut metagenome TaxID=749906 RepID=J9FKH9_9ZZZZ
MKQYPVILSIAGSDCSGGAGIQADIKAISALGGYAASAITAVTVQNTLGVQAVQGVSPVIVCGQIEAVMSDLHPAAVKIGMVTNTETVHVIATCLQKYQPHHVVYDPVMISTSGRKLMIDETIESIKEELLPRVSLLTPNLDEARVLTGKDIRHLKEMKEAAYSLVDTYHIPMLIKGGHLEGDRMCDLLCTTDAVFHLFEEKKIDSSNLHGTGCTLSSAIATWLAKGATLEESVRRAKAYVTLTIKEGKDLHIGHGNGPLWHFPESLAQM